MGIIRRLIARFHDAAYRRSYVESFVDSYLATQIKVLREQRELTQQQLADLVGVKQSQICRWENVNNSGWQIRSLKNLARALDLVLVVKFASFGELVPEIESFSRQSLKRQSFDQDPVFLSDMAGDVNVSISEENSDLEIKAGASHTIRGRVDDSSFDVA